MKLASKILRVLTFLLGALCLAYGFMLGIVGAGPDGPHNSIYYRILGLYVLVLGASYIYSNENKMKNSKRYRIYLIFEFTPVIVLLAATIYSLNTEGLISFIHTDGHYIVAILTILALISPLSLVFENKLKYSNMRLQVTPQRTRRS